MDYRDISAQKYFNSVLIYILDHSKDKGYIKKYDLHRDRVVTSVSSIEKIYSFLEKEGYITIQKKMIGRWTYLIFLTDKGKAVASQLAKAEDIAMGKMDFEMPKDLEEWKNRFKNISALTHINVLDDHITLHEYNYDLHGNDRAVFVYVRVNGNGIMRLWCESDSSFDCPHTEYAWTLPDVQAMVQMQRDKGNISKVE